MSERDGGLGIAARRWTETLIQDCGHVAAVEMTEGRYVEERRAKFRSRPCPACAELRKRERRLDENLAANAELTRRVAAGEVIKVKKGQEVNALPAGARLGFVRGDDMAWTGTLTVPGRPAVECSANGLMSAVSKLARRFLAQSGAQLQGKVN